MSPRVKVKVNVKADRTADCRQAAESPRNVQSSQQAHEVIGLAKTLRKSKNITVRTSVFINPNLTQAEAKAQFEIRQRRRQLNNTRGEMTWSQRGQATSNRAHEPRWRYGANDMPADADETRTATTNVRGAEPGANNQTDHHQQRSIRG